MNNPITRRSQVGTSASIASGATTSAPIDLRGMGLGVFKIPDDWDGGASVTFHVARDPTVSGDFAALHDSSDAAVSQAVTAGKWYPLPAGVMATGAVKVVAASAVGANRTIVVALSA